MDVAIPRPWRGAGPEAVQQLQPSIRAGHVTMLCFPCLGSGEFPAGRSCPKCGGRGDLPDTRLTNPMCPFCVGTGRDRFQKGKLCVACDGWGRAAGPAEPGRAAQATDAASREAAGEAKEGDLASPGVETPHHANQLEDLLRDLVGDVDVCYPSFTVESLDRFRLLERCDMIRVLTCDVEADVLPRIREFVRESPRFLFRRYGGREIHDKYVLTNTEVIFVGPSPKDANGDSPTLIRVPVDVAGEMIQDVRLGFNRLWGAGNTLA